MKSQSTQGVDSSFFIFPSLFPEEKESFPSLKKNEKGRMKSEKCLGELRTLFK